MSLSGQVRGIQNHTFDTQPKTFNLTSLIEPDSQHKKPEPLSDTTSLFVKNFCRPVPSARGNSNLILRAMYALLLLAAVAACTYLLIQFTLASTECPIVTEEELGTFAPSSSSEQQMQEEQSVLLLVYNLASEKINLFWHPTDGSSLTGEVFMAKIEVGGVVTLSGFVGHRFSMRCTEEESVCGIGGGLGGELEFVADPARDRIFVLPNGGFSFEVPVGNEALTKLFVEPDSNAMVAKFRNLSNKRLNGWFHLNEGEMELNGVITPGGEISLATFKGHIFSFTEASVDSVELVRFVMDPSRVLYTYIDEDSANPVDLARYKAEIAFSEGYKNRTGRHWVASYPKGPARTFMWPADFIGQVHSISSNYGLLHSLDEKPSPATFNLECLSTQPRIFIIRNFFSAKEADHIKSFEKQSAKKRDTWINKKSSPMIENLHRRIADVTNVNQSILDTTEAFEGIQLVRYPKDVEPVVRMDWDTESTPGTRFLSLYLYLTDRPSLVAGGEIRFPRARVGHYFGLTVSPKKGDALLFYNQLPDGNADEYSVYSDLIVRRGEKLLAKLWIWDVTYGVSSYSKKPFFGEVLTHIGDTIRSLEIMEKRGTGK